MKLLSAILMMLIILISSFEIKAQTVDTVCVLSKGRSYMVDYTPGSDYYWSINGCGVIKYQSNHKDSIVVDWCSVPGVYTVNVVERNCFGCWGDTVRSKVIVKGNMQLLILGPRNCCIGDAVKLQITGGSNYKWSTGETGSIITVRPKDSTRYSVTGFNSCDIKDSAFVDVRVSPKPKASFTFDPKDPKLNEIVFFHYTGYGASDWTWYFGTKDSLKGRVTDPQFTFNQRGNKRVTLIARNYAGCLDTFSYTLHVTAFSKIFVPDAFTPNGDGYNDVFNAIGYNIVSIHMQIYNRWGERIYESFGMEDAWDGTFQGVKVPEGVYIYLIEARAIDGEMYYLNGNVTVLY